MFGVALILLASFVQSLQYVVEEYVMCHAPEPISPMLLTGIEGLWGTILCLFVFYPIAYNIKGNDHGSLENPFNTFTIFMNTPAIQGIFILYMFSILLYNVLGMYVTFMLDSVWHAILDNFRPVAVWSIDLAIYYLITNRSFGEAWHPFCFVQLLSLIILLYGTAIYNAPNSGSIELKGGAMSCYMDCSKDYEQLRKEGYGAIGDPLEAAEERERLIDSKSGSADGQGNKRNNVSSGQGNHPGYTGGVTVEASVYNATGSIYGTASSSNRSNLPVATNIDSLLNHGSTSGVGGAGQGGNSYGSLLK